MNQKLTRILWAMALVGASIVQLNPYELAPTVAATDAPAAPSGSGVAQARANDGAGGGFLAFRLDCTTVQPNDGWNLRQGATTKCVFTVDDQSPANAPPTGDHANDDCTIVAKWGIVNTFRTFHSGDSCPVSGTEYTLAPTDTGVVGGAPRAGTVSLQVHVLDASAVGGAPIYEAASEGAQSATNYRGYMRFGMQISAITHNGYPAGTTHAYTVAGESIVFTLTRTEFTNQVLTGASTQARLLAAGGGCTAGTVLATGTFAFVGATSATATFTVNDGIIAGAHETDLRIESVQDHTQSGRDFTFLEGPFACGGASTTNHDRAFKVIGVNVDPRVTATHLLSLNDNTFATPPMSGDDCCNRLTSDLAYYATRLTNARGEGLVGASVQLTHTLRDENLLGNEENCASQGVSAQGGEAGWSPYCTWDETLPAGLWIKNVDVTAPATIDADTHLLAGGISYVLAGVNPDLVGTLVYELRHKVGLQLTFFVTSAADASLLPLDEVPAPGVVITRMEDGAVEYLADDGTWQPFVSVADRRELVDEGNGFWTYVFAPGDVDDWGDGDFTITAAGFVGGAPVDDIKQASNIGGYLSTAALEVETSFDSWLPDAFAWLGIATYIILTRRVKDKTLRVALSVASLVVLLFPLASATKAVLSVVIVFVIALDIIATWPGESTKGRN